MRAVVFAWEAVQDFTDENILAEWAKKAHCFSLVSPDTALVFCCAGAKLCRCLVLPESLLTSASGRRYRSSQFSAAPAYLPALQPAGKPCPCPVSPWWFSGRV